MNLGVIWSVNRRQWAKSHNTGGSAITTTTQAGRQAGLPVACVAAGDQMGSEQDLRVTRARDEGGRAFKLGEDCMLSEVGAGIWR